MNTKLDHDFFNLTISLQNPSLEHIDKQIILFLAPVIEQKRQKMAGGGRVAK